MDAGDEYYTRATKLFLLLGCSRQSYTNHYRVDNHPPPWRIRKDLYDRESHFYKLEPLDQSAFQARLCVIHHNSVAEDVN